MSPRRRHLSVTDIRPEVHEQVGRALAQAMAELVTPFTFYNEESTRVVADRVADILRVPHGQVELGGDPPTIMFQFHGNCVELARSRGWRHEPHG